MDRYKKYEPIFGEWYIKEQIGEGSFGRVYKIEREDFGKIYKAALKTITIPYSESEIKSAMAEGMDEKSVSEYFMSCVEQVVDEFDLMTRLKGNSHIVSYENHKVIPHDKGIGWDILIQMELLTPVNDHFKKHQPTQADVIKLGIDICKALEICRKFNIIHRDIKPENLFISEIGEYKLGDFGIARTLEKTTNGLSRKGTMSYMAPEVIRGEAYGPSVDIYSLGLVLYRLLNNNRLPFMPLYPDSIRPSDQESALAMRLKGMKIQKPVNAGNALSEIILKAIAYKHEDRYSSAENMRKELEKVLYSEQKCVFDCLTEKTDAAEAVKTIDNHKKTDFNDTIKKIKEWKADKNVQKTGTKINGYYFGVHQSKSGKSRFCIVGIGGAGLNFLHRLKMNDKEMSEFDFLGISSDAQALENIRYPGLLVGKKLTKGLGTGGDAVIGAKAILENKEEIAAAVSGYKKIFIVCGLGGGMGSGGCPEVLKIVQEMGKEAVVFVTKPFEHESKTRYERAKHSLDKLDQLSKVVYVYDNDKVVESMNKGLTLPEAFKLMDDKIVADIMTTKYISAPQFIRPSW